jgi:hypothetical protein
MRWRARDRAQYDTEGTVARYLVTGGGQAGRHAGAQFLEWGIEGFDVIERKGRGPTMLMSPKSTFQNCGVSSRLVRLRKFPICGRMRRSSLSLK